MGKYCEYAKTVTPPNDSVGHYDFREGFGMAKGQMMPLLADAEKEIEDLANRLEHTRQLLHNLTVAVSEDEKGEYIMAKATMSKEDYEKMLVNEIEKIHNG